MELMPSYSFDRPVTIRSSVLARILVMEGRRQLYLRHLFISQAFQKPLIRFQDHTYSKPNYLDGQKDIFHKKIFLFQIGTNDR
jgi:hypothetical protein